MSKYYKLIDAINTITKINVVRVQNNVTTYGHVNLEPGKKYELGEDEVYIRSLKNAKIEKRYSDQLIAQLKALNVPYEEVFCKSCGGRVKKVSYHVVEVVE